MALARCSLKSIFWQYAIWVSERRRDDMPGVSAANNFEAFFHRNYKCRISFIDYLLLIIEN